MAETKDLKSFKCGFESRRSYFFVVFYWRTHDDIAR